MVTTDKELAELRNKAAYYDEAMESLRDRDDEIERLRAALAAIRAATLTGQMSDDVVWFDGIETLHDFCDRQLAQ